jgi:hypothetical protein
VCIVLLCSQFVGEIWTVSFSLTKDQLKKITPHRVMALLCLDKNDGLDLDDSDEDCTIDYEIVRFSA